MSQLLEGGALGASHGTPLLSLHHSWEEGEHPRRVERGMLALATQQVAGRAWALVSGNRELEGEVAHPKIRSQPLVIHPHMGLDPKAPFWGQIRFPKSPHSSTPDFSCGSPAGSQPHPALSQAICEQSVSHPHTHHSYQYSLSSYYVPSAVAELGYWHGLRFGSGTERDGKPWGLLSRGGWVKVWRVPGEYSGGHRYRQPPTRERYLSVCADSPGEKELGS